MYSSRVQPVVIRKCGACEDVIFKVDDPRDLSRDLTDRFVILGLGHGYVFRKYLCRECYSKVCESLGLDKDNPWMRDGQLAGEIEEVFDDEDIDDLEDGENERD